MVQVTSTVMVEAARSKTFASSVISTNPSAAYGYWLLVVNSKLKFGASVLSE